MKKTIPILITLGLLIIGLTFTAARNPTFDDPARFLLPHKSTPTTAVTTQTIITAVEPAPQIIEFSNGNGILCVNCPKITVSGTAGNIDLFCKDTERSCDLYFGFKKLSDSQLTNGELPYTDNEGDLFNYEIADADEFSPIENNFIIKEEIAGPSSIIEGGMGEIFNEIAGKVIYMSQDNTKPYKLNDISDAEALNLRNAQVSFNKNGEIISINGMSNDASMQKIIPIISEETLNMDIPLKRTEKLTFKGLSGKDKLDLAKPIFEVYMLDEKQDFSQWLETLDDNYKLESEGWWLELCEDEIGPLAFWDYAPGSKFQISSPAEGTGCSISSYLLTTEDNGKKLPRKPYICGELEYYAEPGKLKELFCNAEQSIILCDGDEACADSELSFIADELANHEITIGTNDFVKDSKLRFLGKTGEGQYGIDTDEIKLYRDYVFPQGKIATVEPEAFIGLKEKHTSLKVLSGTNIIREWIDDKVFHTLGTDTNGNEVFYIISIYHGSTVNPALIDSIYPEYYSLPEHGITDGEKEIYSQIYGSMPEEADGKLKINEGSISTSRLNRLPTLGIEVKSNIPLVQGQSPTFNFGDYPIVEYKAIPLNKLKGRLGSEVISNTNRIKIPVKKGEDILDVLSRYCYSIGFSNINEDDGSIDNERRLLIREIADKILIEASRPNRAGSSPNFGLFKVGFSGQYWGSEDITLDSRTTEYFIIQKDGDLFLPNGPIVFKSFKSKEKRTITLHERVCGEDIGDIWKQKKEPKNKNRAFQTCTSSGCCANVQNGDIFKKVYDRKCSNSGLKFKDFKTFVQSNNPIATSKNLGWKDSLMRGDVLNLPQNCCATQTPDETTPDETVKKPECATGLKNSDCRDIQNTGRRYWPDNKKNCEEYYAHCPEKCAWVERTFLGGCFLDKSPKIKRVETANEKMQEKNNEGKSSSGIINIIGRLLGLDEAESKEEEEEVEGETKKITPVSVLKPRGALWGEKPGKINIAYAPAMSEQDRLYGDEIETYFITGAYLLPGQLTCTYVFDENKGIRLKNKQQIRFTEEMIENCQQPDGIEGTGPDVDRDAQNCLRDKVGDLCELPVLFPTLMNGEIEYHTPTWEKVE